MSTISLGRELVQIPVSMFWFSTVPSPRIFTKLLNVPISVSRCLLIRVIICLDDLLVSGNRMNEIFRARDSAIFLLQYLGFAMNLKKFALDPTQEIEFLG